MDEIEVIEKDDGVDVHPVSPPTTDDTHLLPLQGYFNVAGKITGRTKNQLQEVFDYFQQEGKSNKDFDLLMQIRSVENRLKSPRLDETRLSQVYNYVRAQQALKNAEDALNEFVV